LNEFAASDWTDTLAALVEGTAGSASSDVLRQLHSTYQTGDASVDRVRQTILALMDKRLAMRVARSGDEPVPDLLHPGQDVSPLGAIGLAGSSLVAVVTDATQGLKVALTNWLCAPVDEVVLVDWSRNPPVADLLATDGPCDPRLRIVRVDDAPQAPLTSAFNLGMRLARHDRLILITDTVRFVTPFAAPPALPAASFCTEIRVDGAPSAFLEADRHDLAALDGLAEHVSSVAGAFQDLATRLALRGLRASPVAAGRLRHTSRGAIPAPVFQAGVEPSLRQVLMADPRHGVAQDRILALLLAGGPADYRQGFVTAEVWAQGLTVRPRGHSPLVVPDHIAQVASHQAFCELIRLRGLGDAYGLDLSTLDFLLDRPAGAVGAIDIAVAAKGHRDLIGHRKPWLVVDVAPGVPDDANKGLAWFELDRLAAAAGFAMILCAPDAALSEDEMATLSGFVRLDPSVDLGPLATTDVRLLARANPEKVPGSARIAFDGRTITDILRLSQCGPALALRRPKLFLDAQHGLGNRLRAIASAGAIAEATGRELIVVWQPDVHCEARIEDLITPDFAVISQGFAPDAAAMGIDLISYMEVEPGSTKGALIDPGAFGDVYIRSAYPLNHPASTWTSENAYLRRLKPNATVLGLAASVRSPSALAVHIRMEGGADAQHLPYEDRASWTPEAHDAIDHWRKRSHFSAFLPRLDQLIAEGLADTVFVASDTAAVLDEFASRYGDRVAYLPRRVFDRSPMAMSFALADALLLSRAPRLLGSNWSSFTELAARLTTAGKDF
jgi:hypothetical protein